MLFKNVDNVIRWRLCLGCGSCVYVCPDSKILLVDIPDQGIRAELKNEKCGSCDICLKVCPGVGISHGPVSGTDIGGGVLDNSWGPVLEVFEGFAVDSNIRNLGSSGGLATALAAYCLERGEADEAVHTAGDEGEPWKNRTVVSRTREELSSRAGSRYAPASPCEGFKEIETYPGRSVFIGKPCDIQGLRKAESLKPSLRNKAVAIGIFCAGTPATKGVLDLLARLQVAPGDVEDIRFRGNGWPGSFSVRVKNRSDFSPRLSYRESWGFLQAYRPLRCYLCPDGTSEFADISCGDPWYRRVSENELGYSLALVRTERGQKIVHGAMGAGYIRIEKVNPQVLIDSQQSLLAKRRAVWGRLLTMKAFRIPTPKYEGFDLFKNWCQLTFREKARSILGTSRRIVQRKYYKAMDIGQ